MAVAYAVTVAVVAEVVEAVEVGMGAGVVAVVVAMVVAIVSSAADNTDMDMQTTSVAAALFSYRKPKVLIRRGLRSLKLCNWGLP